MKPLHSAASLLILSFLKNCSAAEQEPTDILRREMEGTATEEAIEEHNPFQSRIVGGTIASASDYGFNVFLGGCGGSLIWSDIILTAAHCQPLYPESARIGGSTKITGLRRSIVGYGTRHPNYSPRSQDHDFMVYKLGEPVDITPVPLNRDENRPSNREELTVVGFGSTYEGGSSSFNLREVTVNHVPKSLCNAAYRGSVTEEMFCAGSEGKDSCQGDSGGPILDSTGAQVGVVSWGNGCGKQGFPGVYASVASVYDWIQEQICEMSDDPPASCFGNDEDSTNNDEDEEETNDTSANNGDQDNGSEGNGNSDSSQVQPKGISLRVEINYDEYPHENAWILYNDDTKEQLYSIDYGAIPTSGLKSEIFKDLVPGKYVFLFLDK